MGGDRRDAEDLLSRPGAAFVKWDARPANAVARGPHDVRWFDWEHARHRWRADDWIWLLCDEAIPTEVDVVKILEQTHDADRSLWAPSPWRDYVALEGVLHVCVRLGVSLSDEGAGVGADFRTCVEEDWPGSAEAVRRLCLRGRAWSRLSDVTDQLGDWFGELMTTVGSTSAQ